MNSRTVGIFSGRSEGSGEYVDLVNRLGSELARNNFTIVNGGGPGLMEVVAKSAFENNGRVIGVHFEFEGRNPSLYNTETFTYTELYPRQQKIISLADAFIVLPGGIGTAYELFEILAKKQVGEIQKKTAIILVSKVFWNAVVQLLETQVKKGFLSSEVFNHFVLLDSVDEIIEELNSKFE